LATTIRTTIDLASTSPGESADQAASLGIALDRLVSVTAALWAGGDASVALSNATVYLEAAGHVVLAWIWLEQTLATKGRAGVFYEGKRASARYFFRFELPTVHWRFDLLRGLDRTTLDLDPASL
jgi:hypothetical protein